LTVYLDASVLFSVFHEDVHSERVTAWLAGLDDFAFSRWTVAEVSSALGVQIRARRLTADDRLELERELDRWLAGRPVCVLLDADVLQARQLVRDDMRLRTPDALHVAVALRNGYQLATLDVDMAAAARSLGIEVVVP
jgi:predicted nucleic acid-binding protein